MRAQTWRSRPLLAMAAMGLVCLPAGLSGFRQPQGQNNFVVCRTRTEATVVKRQNKGGQRRCTPPSCRASRVMSQAGGTTLATSRRGLSTWSAWVGLLACSRYLRGGMGLGRDDSETPGHRLPGLEGDVIWVSAGSGQVTWLSCKARAGAGGDSGFPLHLRLRSLKVAWGCSSRPFCLSSIGANTGVA